MARVDFGVMPVTYSRSTYFSIPGRAAFRSGLSAFCFDLLFAIGSPWSDRNLGDLELWPQIQTYKNTFRVGKIANNLL